MTSRLQPLDMGIIAEAKRHFRKRLVWATVEAIEAKKEKFKWNVLDALRAVASAWDAVKPEHIERCFSKAWSTPEDYQIPVEVVVEEDEDWTFLTSIDNNSKVRKHLIFKTTKHFFAIFLEYEYLFFTGKH